jgi:hypothetical protein
MLVGPKNTGRLGKLVFGQLKAYFFQLLLSKKGGRREGAAGRMAR